MRTAIFVLATAATLGGGCAEGLMMMGPSPYVALAIAPGDGATAWGRRDMAIAVNDAAHLLDDRARGELSAQVYVRSWPEGTAVPITTETVAAQDSRQWEWMVRVTPTLPLDDRWYVVGIAGLPTRIVSNASLPDGTPGARFRPDSSPRVASVQFCGKEAPGTKLVLTFSEPVAAPADASEMVSAMVDGQPAACSREEADPGALTFTCGALSPTASVTVSVAAGLASPTGAPLEPASWTIDMGQLPAGSCRTFTPPI